MSGALFLAMLALESSLSIIPAQKLCIPDKTQKLHAYLCLLSCTQFQYADICQSDCACSHHSFARTFHFNVIMFNERKLAISVLIAKSDLVHIMHLLKDNIIGFFYGF